MSHLIIVKMESRSLVMKLSDNRGDMIVGLMICAVCCLQLVNTAPLATKHSFLAISDYCFEENGRRYFLTDLDYDECSNSTCPICPHIDSDCPKAMDLCHICCYTISESTMNSRIREKSKEFASKIQVMKTNHDNEVVRSHICYALSLMVLLTLFGVVLNLYCRAKEDLKLMRNPKTTTSVVTAENEGMDKMTYVALTNIKCNNLVEK